MIIENDKNILICEEQNKKHFNFLRRKNEAKKKKWSQFSMG